MRRARLLGLAVWATCALGALASATASAAAPEFGRCIKQVAIEKAYAGAFSDPKCTKSVSPEEQAKKGKYEWFAGPAAGHNGFTFSGGAVTWQTVNGKTLTCKSEQGKGEYSLSDSKRVVGITFELKGCEGNGGFKCTTVGRSPGEVVLSELAAEVGFENVAKHKTALKLEPPAGASGIFVEFKCVGLEAQIRAKGGAAGAGILIPIKNGKMTAAETLKLKATKGKQRPLTWEGVPAETYMEMNFEHLGYEQAGWNGETTISNDEAIELNRVV
jgi:hypothetical protein